MYAQHTMLIYNHVYIMSMSLQCLIEFDFLNLELDFMHFKYSCPFTAYSAYIVMWKIECNAVTCSRIREPQHFSMKLVIYLVSGNLTHRVAVVNNDE